MSEKKSKAKRDLEQKITAAKAVAYEAIRNKEIAEQQLAQANNAVARLEQEAQNG